MDCEKRWQSQSSILQNGRGSKSIGEKRTFFAYCVQIWIYACHAQMWWLKEPSDNIFGTLYLFKLLLLQSVIKLIFWAIFENDLFQMACIHTLEVDKRVEFLNRFCGYWYFWYSKHTLNSELYIQIQLTLNQAIISHNNVMNLFWKWTKD